MDVAAPAPELDTFDTYQQVAEALRTLSLLVARTARLVALSRAALAETAPIVGRPVPAHDLTPER